MGASQGGALRRGGDRAACRRHTDRCKCGRGSVRVPSPTGDRWTQDQYNQMCRDTARTCLAQEETGANASPEAAPLERGAIWGLLLYLTPQRHPDAPGGRISTPTSHRWHDPRISAPSLMPRVKGNLESDAYGLSCTVSTSLPFAGAPYQAPHTRRPFVGVAALLSNRSS